LLGLGLVLVLGYAGLRGLYPFLAVDTRVPGGVLVVEGWAPDYALAAAVREFREHPYQRLYVTGGPLERGAPLSEYRTYAELGAAIVLRLGLGPENVQSVPSPAVQKDRTYASALALKRWLADHDLRATNCQVISLGPHTRRTRLLFEKALGKEVSVGVMAVEDQDYDPRHWWRSSEGFRVVSGELLAYGYARFWFHPPAE
jgi:uncharacterized SAM-binding protein YcdF (DUF218 family)